MPSPKLLRSGLMAAALVGLTVSHLAAQSAAPFSSFQQDPNQPVDIESDTLTFDQTAGTVVFSGDVVLVQGTMTMSGARMEVFYQDTGREESDGVTRLVATGSVRVASPTETLEADAAVYDLEAGTLDADGNVRLLQGRNALTAAAARINIEAGTGNFTGRVRSTFVPAAE